MSWQFKDECFCGLDLFEFSFWDGFEFSLFLPFGTDCTCQSVVPCKTGRSLFDLVRIQRERCLRNKHLFHLPSPSPPPPRGMDSHPLPRDIVSSSFLVLAISQVSFLSFWPRHYRYGEKHQIDNQSFLFYVIYLFNILYMSKEIIQYILLVYWEKLVENTPIDLIFKVVLQSLFLFSCVLYFFANKMSHSFLKKEISHDFICPTHYQDMLYILYTHQHWTGFKYYDELFVFWYVIYKYKERKGWTHW